MDSNKLIAIALGTLIYTICVVVIMYVFIIILKFIN